MVLFKPIKGKRLSLGWLHVPSIWARVETVLLLSGLQRDVKQHRTHRREAQFLPLCHVRSCVHEGAIVSFNDWVPGTIARTSCEVSHSVLPFAILSELYQKPCNQGTDVALCIPQPCASETCLGSSWCTFMSKQSRSAQREAGGD